MYSNLTLYYLNQMGIRPWIKRDSTQVRTAAKSQEIKLLIFISSTLSFKALSLLKQMMAYINLDEQEVTLISVQENASASYSLDTQNLRGVLLFGLDEFANKLSFTCPVLTSIDPDYLIKVPAKKKQVFKDLSTINQLIS